MRVKDLEELYDYSHWANNKLFEVVAQLTPEEFTKPVAGSYGSVRNTLVHILSAEWGWLDRCGGARRGNALIPADYPTRISLLRQWHQIESHTREFCFRRLCQRSAVTQQRWATRRKCFLDFGSGPGVVVCLQGQPTPLF